MKITKYALFPIVVLLAALLIGCGGGGRESNAGSASAEVKPREETAAVAAGDAEKGQALYQQSCLACHGQDAKGLPNLGKDLTTSTFFHQMSDAEALEFVKSGRPIGDPENTTGIDMPPKGGNPALTDEQILDIVAFLRTLEE